MKLIDLLVQELPNRGGWPEGAYFIACDSDGGVDSYRNEPEKDDTGLNWRDSEGLGYFTHLFFDLAVDWESAIITREQYEAALAASQQASWSGEGLPPVDCQCEAFINGEWKAVQVAYYRKETTFDAIVFDLKSHVTFWTDEFRPIRTEAERKRENAIEALQLDEARTGAYITEHEATAIYDAIASGKIPGVKLD